MIVFRCVHAFFSSVLSKAVLWNLARFPFLCYKGLHLWRALKDYLPMCHAVVVEIGAGCESLAAHATHVRFFTWVDAAMRVERARRAECLTTHIATMRFLSWNKHRFRKTEEVVFVCFRHENSCSNALPLIPKFLLIETKVQIYFT